MQENGQLLQFISIKNNYTLSFIEGRSVIQELAVIGRHKAKGLKYFRDVALSVLPLISLLKPGEQISFVIDSKGPEFRFHLEMNHLGQFRTLLWPETFNILPTALIGRARITKILPGHKVPYTSIIEMNGESLSDVANILLKMSYQIQGKIYLSEDSDQSFMLMLLPSREQKELDITNQIDFSISMLEKNLVQEILNICKAAYNSTAIIKEIETKGLNFIKSYPLEYKCPCSKERMITSILSLDPHDLAYLIKKEDQSIEIKCDYCQMHYMITKEDLKPLKH